MPKYNIHITHYYGESLPHKKDHRFICIYAPSRKHAYDGAVLSLGKGGISKNWIDSLHIYSAFAAHDVDTFETLRRQYHGTLHHETYGPGKENALYTMLDGTVKLLVIENCDDDFERFFQKCMEDACVEGFGNKTGLLGATLHKLQSMGYHCYEHTGELKLKEIDYIPH